MGRGPNIMHLRAGVQKRRALGVTQSAPNGKLVFMFPFLFLLLSYCFLFQKSEISYLEFLGIKRFWVLRIYESVVIARLLFFFLHMKSYFNSNQKKKKRLFESLWGSELGVVLQKFSISDTGCVQQYVGQKRLRETPGGPEEIIPPPNPEEHVQVLGRVVQEIWIRS